MTSRIVTPLREAGGSLATTAAAYLTAGRSVEATARALFVHPNTVRYRLGRIAQVTGYDLADPREAYVVQVSLSVARLDESDVPRGDAGPATDMTPQLEETHKEPPPKPVRFADAVAPAPRTK